jgi:histone acetyltransferase
LIEKRKLEEVLVPEEVKKPKIDGDVPMDLIQEIVATINDPEEMVGPDVSYLKAHYALEIHIY